MRYRMAMLFALALFAFPHDVNASECPEGYFCLPAEDAAAVAEILSLHNCMVDAADMGHINLYLEPHQIIITQDGQVFVEEELEGELLWCAWHLGITAKADALVHIEEPDIQTWGFRLRIRLGAGVIMNQIGIGNRFVEPLILLEPFFIREAHAQVFAGLTHFGLSVGVDLTRNLDIFGGVGLGYREADITPVLGLSLSFN